MNKFLSIGALSAILLLSGCVTPPPPYDYSAFRQAHPRSILVMPPVNKSPDIKGSNSVWAQAVVPLAESGYYVMPIALVAETLRENGLVNPEEALQADPVKLRAFFGADAALYLTVNRYGTAYKVVASDTTVSVEGRLVDLKSGQLLWQGSAQASSSEQQQSNQGGLLGLLVAAVVNQVIASSTDLSHPMAGTANQRLLAAGRPNGMLFGPRSPQYGKDAQPR